MIQLNSCFVVCSGFNFKLLKKRRIKLLIKTNDLLDGFQNVSEHFTKIAENSPKVVQRPDNRFRTVQNNSEDRQRFLKITQDFRLRTDDISMTQKHIKVFKNICNLSSGDLITSEKKKVISTCETHAIFMCEDI